MEYTQQELEELINSIQGDVISSEKVYGGSRPLEIEYSLADGRTVTKYFSYHYPASSDAWAACSITLTMQNNALQVP